VAILSVRKYRVAPRKTIGSWVKKMSTESCATITIETLKKALVVGIAKARSLDEIEAWLKSQRGVKSVQLADYLLKSNPPQRDFIVELRKENASTVRKIVNVFDLGNKQFQFHELRDQ
jgi:hypothetical protein